MKRIKISIPNSDRNIINKNFYFSIEKKSQAEANDFPEDFSPANTNKIF
jgi:hypothetical protein